MPILGWKLTAIWQNFNAEDRMGGGQKILTFRFLFALEIIALPFFLIYLWQLSQDKKLVFVPNMELYFGAKLPGKI